MLSWERPMSCLLTFPETYKGCSKSMRKNSSDKFQMSATTKRLAVVIGNSNYENLVTLTNPVNDAKAIKKTLESLGYDVWLGINMQRNEILSCFKNIMDVWKHEAIEIVVYYSGHGISIDGKVYIAPVDADSDLSDDFIKESFLSMDTIVKPLLKHRKDEDFPVILILDCCRSRMTLESTRNSNQEDPLQNIKGEFGNNSNIAILYSTADNQVALDGSDGSEHSPYTQILLESIMKDWTIYEINNEITRILRKSNRFSGKQVPWMYQCLYKPYRFNLPKSIIGPQGTLTSPTSNDFIKYHFYGVPPMNNNFVDRPNIISKMKASLSEIASSSGSNILALKGLGGMGKTQLMLQYCYLHHSEYNYTFWLEADGKITTLDSFRKLSVNLGLDEDSAKKRHTDESIIDWISAWLQKNMKWLLLLDNVDEVMARELFEVLPRIGGDIILTTREYIPSSKARVISIDKMDENEALSLLLNSQPSGSISQQNEKYAKQIVVELDSIPLAIVLAGAYIDTMQISFEDYLSILTNQYNEIFSYSNEDNSYIYNHTLTTLWKFSFERIRAKNPVAESILGVCAFLQPDSIPVSFFEKQYPSFEHGPYLSSSSSDSENNEYSVKVVRIAIDVLVKFSIVKRVSKKNSGEKEDFLTIHRVVQKAIFNAMNNEQKIRYAHNLATALNNEMNFSDNYAMATQNIVNKYLPHIRHFITLLNDVSQNPLLSKDLEDLLVRTILYLLDNGIYIGTETLAKLVVSVSESIHGVDDISTTEPLCCLARLYETRGIYSDAEPLRQRVLTIHEKLLGSEHPDTARSLNSLAELYYTQGKYTDSEPLFQHALTIREKLLGAEHPDTAESLNNLACICLVQNKYADAEPLFKRALTIHDKLLGPEHPDTARSLSNLAWLYSDQGKYADAKQLYQQALKIQEKILGSEHLDTARSLTNLARLYNGQNKYADAKQLCQRALKIQENLLGPEHLDIATSLNNLACAYCSQGKYADAEPLYRRALTIREKLLGPEHSDIADSLRGLAKFYFKQGKYSDAELLYRRALTILEKTLGPEHRDTIAYRNDLELLHSKNSTCLIV